MEAFADTSNRRVWRALGLTLEARGIEPQGHTDRVVMLAVSLAAELGLDNEQISAIELGAYLHDLGKLELPLEYLQATQLHSEKQWSSIRSHVYQSIELVKHLALPQISLDLMLGHHERWDGSGYPHGLRGLEIPLAARLFAVVDAFVAMTADWFLRRAVTGTGALYELWTERGTSFEPRMVEALARVLRLMVSPDQNYKNLRASRSQHEKIEFQGDLSTIQFVLLDERGYICYASPAMQPYLDPERSTLLDILELIESSERSKLLDQVQEVSHTFNAALEMNVVMPKLGKELRRIETKLIPDEFNETGLVLVWIEPTQTVAAPVIRASDLMHQALISSDASVLLTDNRQLLIEVSPAFLRNTGYSLTDILGKTPRMFQGPKSSREALDVLREGIEQGIACQAEVVNYRKDGTEFLVQISINPIFSSDGSISYFMAIQHDVSAFRKRQIEQQRSLEMVQDAIVVTDLTGLVVYNNIHAEAMINTQINTMLWQNLETPDATRIQEAIQKLSLVSQPMSLETSAYPNNNWSRYLTWNVSISIPDQRLYWIGHDTTELRLIGIEQQRQHQFVSSVLDSATSLVIVCDAQGNIVRLNKTIENFLGYESLTPQVHITKLIPQVHITKLIQQVHITKLIPLEPEDQIYLEKFLEHPHTSHSERTLVLQSNGQNHHISWTATTIYNNEQPEFLVFTGTDITERLTQENQIRESEQRYRTVVESINDAILRINPNGRAIYSNPAWQRLSGYSNSLTISSSMVLKFVHRNHRQTVLRQVLRAIRQQQTSIRLEIRLVSRASRLRWVEARLHMRYEDKEFVGMTAMLTDITNSKEEAVQYHLSHSRHKLYNADDLGAALNALSQFLGAQEAQITSKDLNLSTTKSEVIPFQPDLETVLVQEALSILPLRTDHGINGFLILRWHNHNGHLAESTTLLEYQAVFTEALERVLAYRQIIEREENSKQFIETTLRAQEAERERIAIDLHDGPAQTMVSALRFIETSLENNELGNGGLKKQLERSLELVASSIQQIRETITDLIPPDLEILGLSDVLRQRLEEMSRSENWHTEFHFDPVRLSRDTEVTLYRIVIEALNNARRHAKANQVRLYLWHDKYNTILEVQDNGIGFDTEKPRQNKLHHGIGTTGMKRRAELLGAQLIIESIPEYGTTIRFIMPNTERKEPNVT